MLICDRPRGTLCPPKAGPPSTRRAWSPGRGPGAVRTIRAGHAYPNRGGARPYRITVTVSDRYGPPLVSATGVVRF